MALEDIFLSERAVNGLINVGTRGWGKTPKLYYLTRDGFELLGEACGKAVELGQYITPHKGSRWSPVMYHRMATIDLMLAMEAGVRARRERLRVIATLTEYRRVQSGGRAVPETADYVAEAESSENRIIPDAAFVLENTETARRALFFVETDRGTERITARGDEAYSIEKKLRQYERYLIGGRFAETYAPHGEFRFATVLFVTGSAARIENVRAASDALDERMHSYFRLGVFDEVKEDLLGDVWCSRDATDSQRHALVRGRE